MAPSGSVATRTWDLTECGVPDGAAAISANVTVVDGTVSGDLAFYPGTANALGSTTLSYTAGQIRANNAMIKLVEGRRRSPI